MNIFEEILWLRIPSNRQECGKFLAVAMHGHPKDSLNIVNIYISNSWKFSAQHELSWFKEVIDLGFRRTLSNVVIFWCPVSTDQFYTFDGEKFDIPYFEVKYCHKLSNKDICMLFNIPKQLKLMDFEGHI